MDFCVSNDIATPDSSRVRVHSSIPPVQIAGPFAAKARTLPNYAAFEEVGDGVYSAVVPDPAIWSPEHPVFYRIEFQGGSKQTVGIRKTEVCGASLFIDGRRTVLRATHLPISPAFAELKMSAVCKCGDATTEQSLIDATNLGVPVILDAVDSKEQLTTHSSWACVIAIILPHHEEPPTMQMSANALRLVRITNADKPIPVWSHGAVVPSNILSQFPTNFSKAACMFAEMDLMQPADAVQTNEAGMRRACEQLQCELAPDFDLAGYVV